MAPVIFLFIFRDHMRSPFKHLRKIKLHIMQYTCFLTLWRRERYFCDFAVYPHSFHWAKTWISCRPGIYVGHTTLAFLSKSFTQTMCLTFFHKVSDCSCTIQDKCLCTFHEVHDCSCIIQELTIGNVWCVYAHFMKYMIVLVSSQEWPEETSCANTHILRYKFPGIIFMV